MRVLEQIPTDYGSKCRVFDGTQKLGLSENLTNKAADRQLLSMVCGVGSRQTSPSATGAATVAALTIIREKSAA